MTPEAIRKLCRGLPGVTETIQWGDRRVFKVGDKMFAVIGTDPQDESVRFKCSDESFRLLTELPGIIPAPHLARAQWVRVERRDVLPADQLAAYLRRAYDMVRAALPKAMQAAIAPAPGAAAPKSRSASASLSARRASSARRGNRAR